MPKFEQGQTVWGATISHGRLSVGSAVVKSCGAQMVRLCDGNVAGFRYRLAVPVSEAFASKFEALEHALAAAQLEEHIAEMRLDSAREMTQTARDAIAAMVKP